MSGQAEVVVSLMTLQQAKRRLGGTEVNGRLAYLAAVSGGGPYGGSGIPPGLAFTATSGLIAPGHSFAVLTQRHMHLYGTKREHLAEVAISERNNAIRRPTAIRKEPITLDDYFNARIINDPFCLFDYTMERECSVFCSDNSSARKNRGTRPQASSLGRRLRHWSWSILRHPRIFGQGARVQGLESALFF